MTRFGGIATTFERPAGSAMFRDSAVIARNVHSQVADRIGALIVRGDVLPGDPAG